MKHHERPLARSAHGTMTPHEPRQRSEQTEELLAMSGLLAEYREAEREVAAGKVIPLEALQRKRKARVSRRPV